MNLSRAHVLDSMESKRELGATDNSASPWFSNASPLEQPARMVKEDAESEIDRKEFLRNSGGLLAACVKLGVSTTTMKKLLARVPVSGPTTKKVINAFRTIGHSIASNSPNSSSSKQHTFPHISQLVESPAYPRGVYPSTIRKLQSGQPISN